MLSAVLDATPSQADPPKWRDIPQDDILGVTVILLTCAYNNQEFIRVGYYVNNEYADEALREAPPPVVDITRVARNILAEKPRVTRFPILFDAPAQPAGAAGDAAMGGEEMAGFGAAAGMGGASMDGYSGGGVGFGSNGGFEAAQDGGAMMMA